MQITTHNVTQTLALGESLGKLAPPNTCIALNGSLGAGKTHLTRGIVQGAGVDDPMLVSSPTYVLLNIYPGAKPVFHMDAYRVTSEEDFAAVGFEEILSAGGIAVVEWAQRIAHLLPPDQVEVTIEPGEGEEERAFTIVGTGPVSEALVDRLRSEFRL